VPTVAESGYPDFDAPSWIGLLAPAETPRAIIDRMHGEIATALGNPALAQRFAALGLDVAARPPDAFRSFVAREIAKWTKVAHDHNIVVEE
jgi:tripartite-type tricarboxylate transporter receptor subunit TctC